ncbi:hypothetical protein RAD16_10325 [Bradyrhizobium sp. 18BD]
MFRYEEQPAGCCRSSSEEHRMSLRRSIGGLGPYPSLFLLALPTATVEPLKLVAVAVAGEGHWITGTAMIVACYAFSLLVVERLFVIVKPKLLMIPWFAKLWKAFVSVRTRVFGVFRPGSTERVLDRQSASK